MLCFNEENSREEIKHVNQLEFPKKSFHYTLRPVLTQGPLFTRPVSVTAGYIRAVPIRQENRHIRGSRYVRIAHRHHTERVPNPHGYEQWTEPSLQRRIVRVSEGKALAVCHRCTVTQETDILHGAHRTEACRSPYQLCFFPEPKKVTSVTAMWLYLTSLLFWLCPFLVTSCLVEHTSRSWSSLDVFLLVTRGFILFSEFRGSGTCRTRVRAVAPVGAVFRGEVPQHSGWLLLFSIQASCCFSQFCLPGPQSKQAFSLVSVSQIFS